MKTNPRKEYARYLKELDLESLQAVHARVQRRYKKAQDQGYCSLEAVLYFDLAQVTNEVNQRKEANAVPDTVQT